MKLLLLADGDVGARITEWLLASHPSDVVLIVTTAVNGIFQKAREAGVPAVVFESDEQVNDYLVSLGTVPDLGLVAWWPHIIHQPLLGAAKSGLVNTHPSLLPHNRGKHYNFWAIVEEAPFGVTLHFVSESVDGGDIVAQREISYDWEDNGASLYQKAQAAMTQLVIETYPKLRTNSFSRTPQDSSRGSFHLARELSAASTLDLEKQYKGRELLNLLRARTFAGHPACSFTDAGDEFEVRVDIRRKVR